MSKYKVGDKVRVVSANNPNKQKFIGKVYEIKSCDLGAWLEYLLRDEDLRAFWFAEDELEPASKRGRPRKDACRKNGTVKPSEIDKLKEELKETNEKLKDLARQFIEHKQTTEINICNLGYELETIKPKEKKVELTEAERVILENVDKGFKWIARDPLGVLNLYPKKPYKNKEMLKWSGNILFAYLSPFSNLFQFIRWEDAEPYEIAKLLEG